MPSRTVLQFLFRCLFCYRQPRRRSPVPGTHFPQQPASAAREVIDARVTSHDWGQQKSSSLRNHNRGTSRSITSYQHLFFLSLFRNSLYGRDSYPRPHNQVSTHLPLVFITHLQFSISIIHILYKISPGPISLSPFMRDPPPCYPTGIKVKINKDNIIKLRFHSFSVPLLFFYNNITVEVSNATAIHVFSLQCHSVSSAPRHLIGLNDDLITR